MNNKDKIDKPVSIMRIKILFRLLLLTYVTCIVFDLLNAAEPTSALGDEVHLLSIAALDELMVCLTIVIWFLGTIGVFFIVSCIGLFFFLKWARQLYVFSIIGIVIFIPAFLEDPDTKSIELLGLAPLFFVLGAYMGFPQINVANFETLRTKKSTAYWCPGAVNTTTYTSYNRSYVASGYMGETVLSSGSNIIKVSNI